MESSVKEDNIDSKHKIINAALHLFEKRGYSGTSVNDIVELAGLTKGTFYYYFETKDDLLYLIHDQFIEHVLQKALEILKDRESSCSEKVRRMVHVTWESIDKYLESFTIFFQEMKYINEDKFQVIREKRDKFEKCYIDLIEEGIVNGEFSRVDHPKITSFTIIGMCAWGIHWYRPDGPLTFTEIADIHADMILKGISNK